MLIIFMENYPRYLQNKRQLANGNNTLELNVSIYGSFPGKMQLQEMVQFQMCVSKHVVVKTESCQVITSFKSQQG